MIHFILTKERESGKMITDDMQRLKGNKPEMQCTKGRDSGGRC